MSASYNFSPDVLQQFAQIVIWWAWLEENLGNVLAHLLSADRGSTYVITQNVSGSTIVDWIRTLCPIRIEDPTVEQRIKDALQQFDDLRADRNALVHGLWQAGPHPDTALVHTVRLSRREVMSDQLVSLTDLEETVQAIKELCVEFTDIGRLLGYL